MATLALKPRHGMAPTPQVTERDIIARHNNERDVLARKSEGFVQRWTGYRDRGLVKVQQEDFDYNPVAPHRRITVQARIVGRSRGQPLPYAVDDEG